jgi:Holliday junction resolvase RusA-like endonuclease
VSELIAFSVAGLPMPQGSKTAKIVGKRVNYGGAVAIIAPKVILVEVADMATKTRKSYALKAWRSKIEIAATLALGKLGTHNLIEGPVLLECEFVFERPGSHYTKTTHKLTKRAPLSPGKPDLGHLVRAVEDALSAIVYKDDAQVARYGNTLKRYAEHEGEGAGVRIRVREILA